MRKKQDVMGVAAMLLLIIIFLITSFWVVIYGDSEYQFYEKEYAKYNVLDSLHMEMEDVMNVTDHMMAYLIGEEEELSVITKVDGKEQNFFNEQDRLHMADVKNLFLGGLKLRNALIMILILLIAVGWYKKVEFRELLPKWYAKALAISAVVVAVLGVLILTNFDTCFVVFHKIFFRNDLWLFDPATDYMIRMLPEGFFFDMVIRIGAFFIAELITSGLIFLGLPRVLSKTNK